MSWLTAISIGALSLSVLCTNIAVWSLRRAVDAQHELLLDRELREMTRRQP